MKALRQVLVVILASVSLTANATPDILKKFKEVYGKPNATCLMCHIKPPLRNPYGKAVQAGMEKAKVSDITKEIFQSVEKDDSDGDGVSNGDEIKGDSMPGDPASKPGAAAKPIEPASGDLIPKHTFHPAIVHFPIALLAIAAFLELLSKRKGDELYHKASVINLAIGLICAAAAITTGIISWLRQGYQLQGNLLIHLILASTSILIGIGAYKLRDKPIYLLLILASGGLVMLAGHFGGTMVAY